MSATGGMGKPGPGEQAVSRQDQQCERGAGRSHALLLPLPSKRRSQRRASGARPKPQPTAPPPCTLTCEHERKALVAAAGADEGDADAERLGHRGGQREAHCVGLRPQGSKGWSGGEQSGQPAERSRHRGWAAQLAALCATQLGGQAGRGARREPGCQPAAAASQQASLQACLGGEVDLTKGKAQAGRDGEGGHKAKQDAPLVAERLFDVVSFQHEARNEEHCGGRGRGRGRGQGCVWEHAAWLLTGARLSRRGGGEGAGPRPQCTRHNTAHCGKAPLLQQQPYQS